MTITTAIEATFIKILRKNINFNIKLIQSTYVGHDYNVEVAGQIKSQIFLVIVHSVLGILLENIKRIFNDIKPLRLIDLYTIDASSANMVKASKMTA